MDEKTLNKTETYQPRIGFDANAFSIDYLSTSEEGFKVVTDRTVPKVIGDEDPVRPKEVIATAMNGEMRFNGVDKVRMARAAMNANPQDESLKDEFYAARKAYQAKGKKVGIDINGVDESGALHVNARIVHYPMYNSFASPEQSDEIERMSRLAGTAMVVRTADNRLVVQHRAIETQHLRQDSRSRGNGQYADIPGASVAGMFDARRPDQDKPGFAEPIDTDNILQAIEKEAGEELGLSPNDFESVRITGVAQDKIKIHDEFLLLADTPLTAEQLYEASRQSNRNENLGDADFEEKFFDIDASSSSIAKLLTEVQCPLPPTHAAALVAAGFSVAIEEGGQEYALAWRDQVELGLRDNYARIDEMVSEYYQKFPEALDIVPERYWGKTVPDRNPNGYSSAYGPQEQGLPNFDDAMAEAGLLPEKREPVKKAYLFDVDGPLADPKERRMVEYELADELVERLGKGEPIALNSGRSVEWMEKEILPHITERLGKDRHLLDRFVIVGEKGGAWLTFDQDGEPIKGAIDSITIPDELKAEVDALIREKYSDCVAELDPKTTMLSLEMLPGFDADEFTIRQKELVQELRKIIEQKDLADVFSVDPTTIAIDIESKQVGKHVGADRFLQHLDDLGIKPARFETFGDSSSDVAMADELARRGQEVQFVYVGNDQINEQERYPVINVGNFSRGTLGFLKQ